MALMLALSAFVPTASASYSSGCENCPTLPEVPVTPIDGPFQWGFDQLPYFQDYGFDPGSYTPGGYAGDAPRVECPVWTQANQRPAGCDANQAPPPVTPSNPPCGPDGSMASQVLPQYFADACTAHDICYSSLDSDKGSCDSAFQTNMYRTCEAQHLPTTACRTFMIQGGQRVCASSDLTYHACLYTADAFHAGVQWSWALSRHTRLSQEAQCRQWHLRRDEESNCP